MYAMGTMMFGQEGYHESQKDSCMCVDIASMHEHYAALVMTFYDTHAPDKADNAIANMDTYLHKQTVVKGAQPAYGYSKLYYDLHKKYGTTAIAHESARKAKGHDIPSPIKKEL
jgi:hypothetical protein